MLKLLPIFSFSILLSFLSHSFSQKHIHTKTYIKKEWFFWCAMSIGLILFVGLRTKYNDTGTYLHTYKMMSISNFKPHDISLELGDNPGFAAAQYLLIQLGFSAQSFLMFFSAVTNGIYLWFIRKYSNNLWLSLFLFLFFGGYTFTLSAIKQCVATAFALIGIDRYLEGKRVSFGFWIILASTFHPYALMYLATPIMTFRPWCWKTVVLIIVFAFMGPMLQPLMGTIIDITTLLGEEYTVESFSSEGTNIFRFAVTMVPVLLSLLSSQVIRLRNDRTNNLFFNFTFLQAMIMFVALFGTANYFSRLANYFAIFLCFSLPWLITQFDRRSQRLLTIGAMAGYFLFFYYENGILRPIDDSLITIPLSEYLHSIIHH